MPNRPNKAKINAQIDENLRRVFEEDAATDLPPHLTLLLNQLDEIKVQDANLPRASDASDPDDDGVCK